MRAHLYRVITNVAGDIQPDTEVRILQPDTAPVDAIPVTDTVFTNKVGATETGTTFTATDGVIDVWMDAPQYVMLGLTPPLQAEYFIDNVAVAAPTLPAQEWSGYWQFDGNTARDGLALVSTAYQENVIGDATGHYSYTDPETLNVDPGIYSSVMTGNLTWVADPGVVTISWGGTFILTQAVPSGGGNYSIHDTFPAGPVQMDSVVPYIIYLGWTNAVLFESYGVQSSYLGLNLTKLETRIDRGV